MANPTNLIVGPQLAADSAVIGSRAGRQGDQIVSELHGRFYEQCLRGNLYGTGMTSAVALSANTITLTATTTPILGIYNPPSSPVNAVVLQATLQDYINNVTSVFPGPFVWAGSTGNVAVSTGLTPTNLKTLAAAGSNCKGFAGATALTGLTNNLVAFMGAGFPTASGLLTTTVAASTPTPSVGGVENIDGAIIVVPGGVLALLNVTSSTTHSVWGRLIWEEVPI